jgi:Lrp/AsnC family leucine-responsive transcriptional regulator
MIDINDLKILKILQGQARAANAKLAERLKLAPSVVFERVRKLEAANIICGYEARVNAKALGLGQVAFVFVRADERTGKPRAGEQLAKLPEVLEVHHVAGEDCYLLKVRVRDTEALGKLLREKIGAVKTVRSTRSTIVLSTLKETSQIPLDQLEAELKDA